MADTSKPLNLVWGILEGFHGGAALGAPNHPPLTEVPFPAVRFTNMVCSAPSTTMSLLGLLSGTNPIRLRASHLSKGAVDSSDWRRSHPQCLPFLLEKHGYKNVFLSWVKRFGATSPVFPDGGEGLTDELVALNATLDSLRGGYGEPLQSMFWLPEVNQARTRNVLRKYRHEGPGAFVIHAACKNDLAFFFAELETIGVSHRNSVMLVVGDHGWPRNLALLQQRRPDIIDRRVTHDTDLDETNIRVVGFLGYPGIEPREIHSLTSALDLYPTIVRLLGLQQAQPAGETDSRDLTGLITGTDNPAGFDRGVVRIDNRYLDQKTNRITVLVNDGYRYVVRPSTDWERNPFYKYRLAETPHREELYARADVDEQRNLARHPAYRDMLEQFRIHFRKTETEAILSHFRRDLFAYHRLAPSLPWNGSDGPATGHRPHEPALLLKAASYDLREFARRGIPTVAVCGDGPFVDWLIRAVSAPEGMNLVPLTPQTALSPLERSTTSGLLVCWPHPEGRQLGPAIDALYDITIVRSLFGAIADTVGELRRIAPFVRSEDFDRFVAGSTVLYGTGSLADAFLSTTIGGATAPRIVACSVTDFVPAGRHWRTWDLVDPYDIAGLNPGQVVIASSFLDEIVPFLRSIADGLRLHRVHADGVLDPRPL
jgi:hypothetical protein